jgi:molybdopterin-guanine dinucleotide biosynthesis protein A
MVDFGDAFILCGGKSSRMGFDKSLLRFDDGQYVLEIMADKLGEIFDRVGLCANVGEKFLRFDLPVVEDIYREGLGPAAAIHAALTAARSRYVFVAAVDMPFLNLEHIRHMMSLAKDDVQAVVPINGGLLEPLYALYSKSALWAFEEQIKAGNFALRNILPKINTVYLDEDISRSFDNDLLMFANLNYVEDLAGLGIAYD